MLCFRVLEQHWDVVAAMSSKGDMVAYQYYVGLLKISEDKVRVDSGQNVSNVNEN